MPAEPVADLAARLAAIHAHMARAAEAAHRPLSEITLIAVSKFHPASAVQAAARLGQRQFGENYLQEAMQKQEEVGAAPDAPTLHWHFIGHLQSRKAAEAAGRFCLIHTLDSEKTAHRLARACEEKNVTQEVLIQVNIGHEAQKSGVEEAELPALARAMAALPRLRLTGLMCLPPVFDDPAAARPFFRRLRLLRDDLAQRTGLPLPHLSMGMSGDFEAAIAEGATLIRVGTDIFGPRPSKKA